MTARTRSRSRVSVFSDCDSAINTVVSNSELNIYPDMHQKLVCSVSSVTFLSLLSWSTFWDIRAYSTMKWQTEKLKEVARMISVGSMSAPIEISPNDAWRISGDIAHKSWQ